MITPQMPRNISFRVDTMFVNNKNKVGRIKPDENGIYKGLPMMPLGQVSQQQTYYDPQSIMEQITNPSSHFNIIYRQQKAFGEYGHPTFYGLSDAEKMQRLCTIDEKMVSHLFTGIYTDTPFSDGSVMLRADLKPTGPYGKVFKESLDDPVCNTAFSLRSFVDTKVNNEGLKYRKVLKLTTWDYVGPSGFANTDKNHAIGLESFSSDNYLEYDFGLTQDGKLIIDQIALETLTDSELNEIFGTNKIPFLMKSRTIIRQDDELSSRFPNLYKTTIFNEFFKDGK